MNFCGTENNSSLGEWSLTLGSTWWRYMKLPDMDQKSFIASPATGNESWGCGRDPSDSPRKSMWLSPWIGGCRTKVDVLSSWSPPWCFDSSIFDWKNKFSLFGKHHVFRIESFRVDFWCVHRLQLLKVCDQYVTLPNSPPPPLKSASEEQSRNTFFPNWWIRDCSFAVIGWCSTNEPSGTIGFFEWLPKTSFKWCLPIRQEICDVSQIGVVCPPTLIATLQQRCLPLLCALLFQQFHQSPICVAWTNTPRGCHQQQNVHSNRSIHPLGLSPPGLLVLDAFFHILLRRRSVDVSIFHACSYRVGKLQLFPFTHCPLLSHCQQSPGILCTRCFVPWFLTTGSFQNFHFWHQNYCFEWTSCHQSFQSVTIRF